MKLKQLKIQLHTNHGGLLLSSLNFPCICFYLRRANINADKSPDQESPMKDTAEDNGNDLISSIFSSLNGYILMLY